MKILAFTLVLAAAPFAAIAGECGDGSCDDNGLSYTYVQGDYIYEDGGGAAISGSYAFTDNIFAVANYAKVKDSDTWRTGQNTRYAYDNTHKYWAIGVGFNKALGTRADWVSQLAYAHHDFSFRNRYCVGESCTTVRGDDDLSGFNISTGVRGRLTNKLSGNAHLGYEDYGHYNGNAYASFGLGYDFNPMWSIQTGVRFVDDDGDLATWNLGVRASF